MKKMSFKKKALVATGVIATVGGTAWFLTRTEKGRALTQKVKDKVSEWTAPNYCVEEYTFVFKEPYDYEKECLSGTKTTLEGKESPSVKFLNMRPVTQRGTSTRATRQHYLQQRRQNVAKLFKEGYSPSEIAKQLVISIETVNSDLNYLRSKYLIR